jgi:hypothetical protein
MLKDVVGHNLFERVCYRCVIVACQTIDVVFALPTLSSSSSDWSEVLGFINAYITGYLTIGAQNVRVSTVADMHRELTKHSYFQIRFKCLVNDRLNFF